MSFSLILGKRSLIRIRERLTSESQSRVSICSEESYSNLEVWKNGEEDEDGEGDEILLHPSILVNEQQQALAVTVLVGSVEVNVCLCIHISGHPCS